MRKESIINTIHPTKTARINIRVSREAKEAIQALAKKCGLSTTRYIELRALGYEPKAAPSSAFWEFYRKLCEVANLPLSYETEERLYDLIDDISAEFLFPARDY